MNRSDLAFCGPDLVEHGLQPLLELAAILRSGDQGRPCRASRSFLSFKLSGTSPLTMRWARPSYDEGLADPGFADQDGIVPAVRRERTWIVRRISSSRSRCSPGFEACRRGRPG